MARRRRKRSNRKPYRPRYDKPNKLYFEGVVEKALPNAYFQVRTDAGFMVLAAICGKMRRARIRVLPGDRVNLELSGYDPSRGRIVYRQNRRREAA